MTAKFTATVMGETLTVRVDRGANSWTMRADGYPDLQVCAVNFDTCKETLAKRLRPLVERAQKRRAKG